MERTIFQQFFDYIDKSNNILIALPEQPSFETVSSAYALELFLYHRGKQAHMASATKQLPYDFGFMDQAPAMLPLKSGNGSLVVSLRTVEKQLDELSYAAESESVKIFLKAKDGTFSPEDIVVSEDRAMAYDLILTISASSLDDLGPLFQDQAKLFYALPKIVLDTKAKNEYFGAVNMVDVTASSHGELLASLLLEESSGSLHPDVATLLLASIISATGSFQDVRTTPRTLAVSAKLIEAGARQQDIVVRLFKTKDFSLLKLWGRVLARIKTQDELLLYSTLNRVDFDKTNTGPAQLLPVFCELLDNISGYQIICLLAETIPGKLQAVVAALPHVSLETLFEKLSVDPAKTLSSYGTYRLFQLELPTSDIAAAESALLHYLPEGSKNI
jgi:nanoRNase/pAp phosphatase (c-di-AMP/oligoRNAs hydrolase)